ncbi:uncharacterized protein METZ01_LOCUS81550 [marine metagenome]|uniref:Uncharacterized protein n=1 Tax=marine metagenome TaxID=408172 RepID=A0A381UKJ4_9ZZZZ
MVAATVVPPVAFCTIAVARLSRLSFHGLFVSARRSNSEAERPTRICPSITAMVAGTAPAARITVSAFCAA